MSAGPQYRWSPYREWGKALGSKSREAAMKWRIPLLAVLQEGKVGD
jgi:hypothetical protein